MGRYMSDGTASGVKSAVELFVSLSTVRPSGSATPMRHTLLP